MQSLIEHTYDGREGHATINVGRERSDLGQDGVQARLVNPTHPYKGLQKLELPIQATAFPRVEFVVLSSLHKDEIEQTLPTVRLGVVNGPSISHHRERRYAAESNLSANDHVSTNRDKYTTNARIACVLQCRVIFAPSVRSTT